MAWLGEHGEQKRQDRSQATLHYPCKRPRLWSAGTREKAAGPSNYSLPDSHFWPGRAAQGSVPCDRYSSWGPAMGQEAASKALQQSVERIRGANTSSEPLQPAQLCGYAPTKETLQGIFTRKPPGSAPAGSSRPAFGYSQQSSAPAEPSCSYVQDLLVRPSAATQQLRSCPRPALAACYTDLAQQKAEGAHQSRSLREIFTQSTPGSASAGHSHSAVSASHSQANARQTLSQPHTRRPASQPQTSQRPSLPGRSSQASTQSDLLAGTGVFAEPTQMPACDSWDDSSHRSSAAGSALPSGIGQDTQATGTPAWPAPFGPSQRYSEAPRDASWRAESATGPDSWHGGSPEGAGQAVSAQHSAATQQGRADLGSGLLWPGSPGHLGAQRSHLTQATEGVFDARGGSAQKWDLDEGVLANSSPERSAATKQTWPSDCSPNHGTSHCSLPLTAAGRQGSGASSGIIKKGLRRSLEDWGLPPGVIAAYRDKGICQMYAWQAAALEEGEHGSNLVYCAPTSGGKTLVAEVLMVRQLLRSQHVVADKYGRKKQEFKKALIVLPFVALVAEKAADLEKVLPPMGCTVRGYYGTDEASAPLAERGEIVAVCTIEKANVAINRLVQQGRLGELCCVVVDELHMVCDPTRGLALELSLIKLLHYVHTHDIQIVGMSATMGGLEKLQSWLNARLFVTNFRPTQLTEHLVFGRTVYVKAPPTEHRSEPVKKLRELAPSDNPRDRDGMLTLIAESAREGGSVLVFCTGRKQTESCAGLVTDALPGMLDAAEGADVLARRVALVARMQEEMGAFCNPVLERFLLAGVGYHHAGMTSQERTVVESGFRGGEISVLTATSTLAAGINLPAKRVILRSLHQGNGVLSRGTYLQMVGRAGRAGHASSGDSFLIGQGDAHAASGEWQRTLQLLSAPLPSVRSRVLPESVMTGLAGREGLNQIESTEHVQQLLLEAVANGSISRAKEDLGRLARSTLASHQVPYKVVHGAIMSALQSLRARKLLSFREVDEGGKIGETVKVARWQPTELGRAVYDSSLPLEAGIRLHGVLSAAISAPVVLDEPLHLVYLILQEHSFTITNWQFWGRKFAALPPGQRAAAEALGVSDAYISRRCSGHRGDERLTAAHERFACACAVTALLHEEAAGAVAAEWGAPGGLSQKGVDGGELQKLQSNISKWAAMAGLMCASAGWANLELLLNMLSMQAAAGCRSELLPLMQVPSVTAAKARMLFAAGISTPEILAAADERRIAEALALGLKKNTRRPKRPLTKAEEACKVGITGASGTNAVVGRDAKALQEAAREYAIKAAEEARKEALGIDALSSEHDSSESDDEAEEKLGSEDRRSSHATASTSAPLRSGAVRGCAAFLSLGADSNLDQIRAVLAEMAQQRRLAISIVTGADSTLAQSASAEPGTSEGGSLQVAPFAPAQAIVVCWDVRHLVHLDLSKPPAYALGAALIWESVGRMLQSPTCYKVAWGVSQQLPALERCGLPVQGTSEDPEVAAWLLWPERAAELSPKQLQTEVAPRVQVTLPLLGQPAVASACEFALHSWAVIDPLIALLRARGLLQVYRKVEMPHAALVASSAANGLAFDRAVAKDQLQSSSQCLAFVIQRLHNFTGAAGDYTDPGYCVRALVAGGVPLSQFQRQVPSEECVDGFLESLQLIGSRLHPKSRAAQVWQLICEGVTLHSSVKQLHRLLSLADLGTRGVTGQYANTERLARVHIPMRTTTPSGAMCPTDAEDACIIARSSQSAQCTSAAPQGSLQRTGPALPGGLRVVTSARGVAVAGCSAGNPAAEQHGPVGLCQERSEQGSWFQPRRLCQGLLRPSPPFDVLLEVVVPSLQVAVAAQLSQDALLAESLATQHPQAFLAAGWGSGKGAREVQAVLDALFNAWGPARLGSQLGITHAAAISLQKSFLQRCPQLADFLEQEWVKAQASCSVQTWTGRRTFLPPSAKPDAKAAAEQRRNALAFVLQGSLGDAQKALAVSLHAALQHLPSSPSAATQVRPTSTSAVTSQAPLGDQAANLYGSQQTTAAQLPTPAPPQWSQSMQGGAATPPGGGTQLPQGCLQSLRGGEGKVLQGGAMGQPRQTQAVSTGNQVPSACDSQQIAARGPQALRGGLGQQSMAQAVSASSQMPSIFGSLQPTAMQLPTPATPERSQAVWERQGQQQVSAFGARGSTRTGSLGEQETVVGAVPERGEPPGWRVQFQSQQRQLGLAAFQSQAGSLVPPGEFASIQSSPALLDNRTQPASRPAGFGAEWPAPRVVFVCGGLILVEAGSEQVAAVQAAVNDCIASLKRGQKHMRLPCRGTIQVA